MTEATSNLPTIPHEMYRELAAVVGEDAVHIEREEVDGFKDDYWIPGDETYAASAVVQPTETEQVQQIMRIANRYGIPVWPHGQGRGGYGGASPRVRGSIQIGFQRMNRVLEVNDELAYAVVEPGVTFFDLHDAVKASGYRLMTPCTDLGWGSVIGNSMDLGATYQQYGADFMLPTGFEVVLPDGEMLRTGAGAIPGSEVWHLYKRSLGPALDSLFVQSNLGIVTRMGVWLKRLPDVFAPLMLSIGEDNDLEAAVDTIRELRLAGHIEGVPTLYPTLRAAVMLRDEPVLDARVQITADHVREIAERTGVGAWAARAAIWGDAEVVDVKLRRIKEAWARIPSGRVEAPRTFTPDQYDEIVYSADQILAGIPTLKALENTPSHVGHVGFSPVVPLKGTEVRYVVNEMRKHIQAAGLNFSGGILIPGERYALVIAGMQYDKTDAVAIRNAMDLAGRLVREVGKLGYGEYRAHLEFMDHAADQYSFNDHAYRRFVERIKDAVDPNGILSPGRHGIWPAAYREGGPLSDRV